MSKKKEKEEIKIHPLAEAWAMLPEDELEGLTEDIKANGLKHPIVLDEQGRIVDGRNRFAACLRAGIEPKFQSLNGQDVATFVLSENERRRHSNKSQRAMAVAIVSPEGGEQGAGRGNTKQSLKLDFHHDYLVRARFVLKHAPAVAMQVRDGHKALPEAYAEAQQIKKNTEETLQQLTLLKQEAPDLALLVDEERMTLIEAIAAYQTRLDAKKEEDARQQKEAAKLAERMRALNEESTTHFIRSIEMLDALFGVDSELGTWTERLWNKLLPDMIPERTFNPSLWRGDGLIELADQLRQFGEYVIQQGGLKNDPK